MNIRPDNITWMRMIEDWNRKDASFSDTFTTEDRSVLVRLAAHRRVKVLQSNVSTYGRTTMLFKVKGRGNSKKDRRHTSARILVDVFEDEPVHVFIKSPSIEGASSAVLMVQPVGEIDPAEWS